MTPRSDASTIEDDDRAAQEGSEETKEWGPDWKSFTQTHFRKKMQSYAWCSESSESVSTGADPNHAPANDSAEDSSHAESDFSRIMHDPLAAGNMLWDSAVGHMGALLSSGARISTMRAHAKDKFPDSGRVVHGGARTRVRIAALEEQIARCKKDRDSTQDEKERMEREEFRELLEPGIFKTVLKAKDEQLTEKTLAVARLEGRLAELEAERDWEPVSQEAGAFERTPSIDEIAKLRQRLSELQRQNAPCEHVLASLRRQIGALEFKESRAHKIRSNCPKDSSILCYALPWRRPENQHWFGYYQHGRAFAFTQYPGAEQVAEGSKIEVPGWWFEGIPSVDKKKKYEAIAVEYSARHVFQPAGKSTAAAADEAIRFVCPLREFKVHDHVIVDEPFFPNTNNWAPMVTKHSVGVCSRRRGLGMGREEDLKGEQEDTDL